MKRKRGQPVKIAWGPPLAAARRARRRAYAPYSRFRVGAAVVDRRGRVFAGCNVENAAYPLTVCAERHAIAAAVAAGARELVACVVVTDQRPFAMPCGACRQVLHELCGEDAIVALAGPRGGVKTIETHRLATLLPHAFGASRRR